MEKYYDEKSLNFVESDKSLWRIRTLLEDCLTYREICQILNDEKYLTITGKPWQVTNLKILIYKLRHKVSSFYARSQKKAGLVIEPLAA